MSRPFTIKNGLHRDPALSVVLEKLGGDYYLSISPIRPTTPTILNVATTGSGWTALATGLTDVLSWKVVEENGNDFRYAFEAAPSTYIVGFGWVSDITAITNIYVQRPGSSNINTQLLYWKK